MRIISFVNGNSGPSYHRAIMPLLLMNGPDVYITNNLLEEHFEKGCDIFMYNRTIPDHAAPLIAELKEKYGFKTCVDVDDFWELDPHHIMYEEYEKTDFAREQIEHLKNADVVFTTHERLLAEIVPYNKEVHILPNAIPKQWQFDIERKPYHLTRLFWQGSDTHKADIQLLRRPIDCLSGISGKILMVMSGFVCEGMVINGVKYTENHAAVQDFYDMAKAYTAGFKCQYKLIPKEKVEKYYNHYAEADICLVPLLNTKFNRFKSNLKVLEAANLALPVICSQVHPYLDLPVLYAKGTGDWVHTITKLVNSKKRQKECGQELKEYCDKNFNFHKINNERKQILEHVSKTISV